MPHSNRIILKDDYVRLDIENDVKGVINSDTCHPIHLHLQFRIVQVRRRLGKAKESNILNMLSRNKLLKN